jgi:hypothetical protein
MKYYLDTEFIESPCTIDLISIAIVREDGRYLYAENSQCDFSKANDFVKQHVLPQLIMRRGIAHAEKMPGNSLRILAPPGAIKSVILEFIGDNKPEFWGYYADYDWVAFCWLFGAMVDLPRGWPMYCRDLKQLADQMGVTSEECPVVQGDEHNALSDARWNLEFYKYLVEKQRRQPARLLDG